MSRTIDDLRQALESHGRELPPSSARTVAVHRRIRRIRRQRTAAGVVAAVVVVGAAAGVGSLRGGKSTTSVAPSHGFAEYEAGGRLASTLDIDTSVSATATGSFTATSSTLIVIERNCTAVSSSGLFVALTVNGKMVSADSCFAGASGTATEQPGIKAGDRVSVSARLVHGAGPSSTPLTAAELKAWPATRVDVGIFQPVARADYHFPPVPERLLPLPVPTFEGYSQPLTGGNGVAEMAKVDVRRGLDLEGQTVAPGLIIVSINGHQLGQRSSWGYAVTPFDYRLTPTQLARLGVSGDSAKAATVVIAASDFLVTAPPVWQVFTVAPSSPNFSTRS